MSHLPQQPPIISATNPRFILSWWEREIHLWVLLKPATEILDPANEDVDLDHNRKLLKTIVVKGDSNISSATINQDGTLLVVSTATDIKAFRLEHQNPEKPSDLKLASVELPAKLTKLGASKVQLSPDSSWLCLVQDGLRVLMAKVEHADDKQTLRIPAQSIRKISRRSRNIPRHIQNGGLGNYDRNITHIAFSPDSHLLATADLAGYVDTWVLREQSAKHNGEEDDNVSSSSGSDSSDSEADSAQGDVTGWVRNPRGKLLPKLPTAPAVLAFAADVPAEEDYTLLAITNAWNLLTFNPLQGALTQWTRRNPRKTLPAPVQDLLDIPKGVFWQGPRAWIYGVSFLIMIDLTQDLPKPHDASGAAVDQVGLKRKRVGRATGAGGKMAIGNLAPHQITKHVDNQEEDVDMDDNTREDDGSGIDDEMDGPADEVTQLRNGESNGVPATSKEFVQTGTGSRSWWMTYKYRPIFGAVQLGKDEIAMVERPMWDVDMPERYFTD